MITLVKLQRKGQMTLPSHLREAIGVKEGDMIEVTLERGKVVLTPKVLMNRGVSKARPAKPNRPAIKKRG